MCKLYALRALRTEQNPPMPSVELVQKHLTTCVCCLRMDLPFLLVVHADACSSTLLCSWAAQTIHSQ
jgi:hypothetical protein